MAINLQDPRQKKQTPFKPVQTSAPSPSSAIPPAQANTGGPEIGKDIWGRPLYSNAAAGNGFGGTPANPSQTPFPASSPASPVQTPTQAPQPFTPTVTSPTNIVGGSSNLRDQESQTKAQGTNALGNINAYTNLNDQITKATTDLFGQLQNATPYEQTDEYKNNQGLIDQARSMLGSYTPQEQQQIDQQAQAAGAAFDPLISKANEEKSQGEGTSLVSAGQAGGLMNSQLAGQAAISKTQGGDFFGAGGRLEEVRSAYDANISQLQSAKTQSIQAAKAAAQEAIRTGKSQNLQIAQDLFAQAQQHNERANQMAQDKINVLKQLQTVQQQYLAQGQVQAQNIATGAVDIDAEGNINKPTDEQLQQISQEQGVDFNTLKAGVNERYDSLLQMNAVDRQKEALANKQAGVAGTGAGGGTTKLQYHAATKYNPAGYFNPATGQFTPLGKGGGGAAGGRSRGGTGGTGGISTIGGAGGQQQPGINDPLGLIAAGKSGGVGGLSVLSGKPLTDSPLPPHFPPGKDVGGYNANAIDLLAKNFHETGQMQGLGTSKAAQAVRAAVTNRAALLFSDQPGSQATKYNNKALGAALSEQTKYANSTERSVKNADNAFKQLLKTFDKSGINTSQSAIANKWVNDFKRNLSGGDQRAFDASLQEVANEYSQVFSRGGSTSEATRADAERILSGNISITDLKKIQQQLQAQGDIVIQGSKDQIKSIQDQLESKTSEGGDLGSTDSSGGGTGDDPLGLF